LNPQSIYALAVLNDGGMKTIIMRTDVDLNSQYMVGFDKSPNTRTLAVTPNGSDLFFVTNYATLEIFNMEAQTGNMKGVYADTNLRMVTGHKMFPSPDSLGIYFTGKINYHSF
jgi:hypothetical protein